MDDQAISIDLDIDRRINYAMQQNDVPVVASLRVTNNGETSLDGATVEITLGSDLAEPWTGALPNVAPGATVTLDTVDIVLDSDRLVRQTEREATTLEVSVSVGDAVLAKRSEAVEVLAYNEWGGLASLPEIAAAFVLPNHPGVDLVLARAGELLAERTGNGALSGYTSNERHRVRAMVAAVWTALVERNIEYATPPASYESQGQKVRSPDQVLGSGLGTCLDLTLLLAACLEQAGLHPLLIFCRSHALVGCWTLDRGFGEPSVDAPLRLAKRVKLGDIVACETTLLTADEPVEVEAAIARAEERLLKSDDVLCTIDVWEARRRRIRPLPLRIGAEAWRAALGEEAPLVADAPGEDAAVASAVADHTETGDDVVAAPAAVPEQEADPLGAVPADETAPTVAAAPEDTGPERLQRWKRRLLDLSLRNRLLNYRESKRTIPLQCEDPAAIEDGLAGGLAFRILPRHEFMQGADPRSPAIHEERTGEDPVAGFLIDEIGALRLHADLPPGELDKRLLEVYRAARVSLEETGANVLYLAVGFLTWYESDEEETPRRAPILLLPLQLKRGSVREGFRVELADDDARINVTLLEKLRSEFGLDTTGLDTLTEDESGYDVEAILSAFRRAVADFDRWDVEDSATIGLFSFAKFLMWRDLEESADVLLRNDMARHLIERPGEAFPGGDDFAEAASLDQDYSPHQVLCPLDADSSQLRAVLAAVDGRSFRLEGPPGTGKSQTIANMVAQALGSGQRVLFVAEKQAALEVVQRRVAAVGLGPFCLAVHSAKATKRDVLAQLGEALDVVRSDEPGAWRGEADRLALLRDELNEHVLALHSPGNLGRSVYDVVSRLIALKGVPDLDLRQIDPLSLSESIFPAVAELCDRAGAALQGLGRPADHDLFPVRLSEWTPALAGEAGAACVALTEALEQLRPLADETATALGWDASDAAEDVSAAEAPPTETIDDSGTAAQAPVPETTGDTGAAIGDGLSARDLAGLAELVALVLNCPGTNEPLLSSPDWGSLRTRLEVQIERAAATQQRKADLSERWTDQLFAADVPTLVGRLRQAKASFVLVGFFTRRGVRGELAALSRGELPHDEAVLRDLDTAIEIGTAEAELSASDLEAAVLLGSRWASGRGDPTALRAVVEWAGRVRGLLAGLAGTNTTRLQRLAVAIVRQVTEGADQIAAGTPRAQRWNGLAGAVETAARRGDRLAELLQLDTSIAWGQAADGGYIPRLTRQAMSLRGAVGELRPWCHWQGVRAELTRAELQPLIDGLESGELSAAQAPLAHERAVLDAWLTARLTTDDRLRVFHGGEHTRKIERFAELDGALLQLNQQVVAARLAAGLPSTAGEANDNSELGILQRELRKKRRHLPLRKLFATLPHLLPRLKPCLLMSPLAVAQHLAADITPFDLVIFDEASQIPVWDAVGAIARGRHVVVVGDSRQLPPTTFFMKSTDDADEYDDEAVEELESLLDECAAARLPGLDLLWHYRSRDEALIAFSNAHYYKGRLNTFPAAASTAADRGVSLVHLPGGVYDRSHSRTNKVEAEAVVAEVCRRMKVGETPPSLGVVSASMPQQQLIEELIEAARREDGALDARLSEETMEPLFVKNLENVQGDERDVILFTVGYGPDVDGKVSMNFGPLNREGGERRLNVAITRSRCEMVVFTSLRPEQIDLSRTRAVGVAQLKSYLDYAARGPAVLAGRLGALPADEAETGELPALVGRGALGALEEDVASRLVERGWRIERRVGCSAYRVDLAVRDDEDPERFLLGIECDGPTYSRASTARDRDRLRGSVLAGLGWRLHRVWSTEWWLDRERELARLDEALTAAAAERNAERSAAAAAAAAQATTTEPAVEAPPEEDAGSELFAGQVTLEAAPPETALSETIEAALDTTPDAKPDVSATSGESALLVYLPCDLGPLHGDGEQFYDTRYIHKVAAALEQVVRGEGPVQIELATRRLAAAWGIDRLTAKVRGRVDAVLATLPDVVRREDFLWMADMDPGQWRQFRVPADEASERRPEELPSEELAAAAAHVLAINISLPRPDLEREMARLFGYQRSGRKILEATARGIELLVSTGGCVIRDEKVDLA